MTEPSFSTAQNATPHQQEASFNDTSMTTTSNKAATLDADAAAAAASMSSLATAENLQAAAVAEQGRQLEAMPQPRLRPAPPAPACHLSPAKARKWHERESLRREKATKQELKRMIESPVLRNAMPPDQREFIKKSVPVQTQVDMLYAYLQQQEQAKKAKADAEALRLADLATTTAAQQDSEYMAAVARGERLAPLDMADVAAAAAAAAAAAGLDDDY